jgi:aspartate aminotransferase-like enzyme
MKGRIFRIGHLGDVSVDGIVSALDVIEQGAGVVGLAIEPGAGQAAARSAAGEL